MRNNLLLVSLLVLFSNTVSNAKPLCFELKLYVVIISLYKFKVLSQFSSRQNLFGNKRETFFLNLEDGYFGCQVNESAEFLQIYDISRLCDDFVDCFLASDENKGKLKCTGKYHCAIIKIVMSQI